MLMKSYDQSGIFLTFLAKKLVIFMHEKNMPLTSIFTENVLEFVPRCNDIYSNLLDWEWDEEHNNEKFYSTLYYILDQKDGTKARLSFSYPAVKYKLLKEYLLYNITWRKEDAQ